MDNEYKFQIGDKVVSKVNRPDGLRAIKVGTTGTVVELRRDGHRVGVRWDFEARVGEAHSCEGNCTDGYGWYVNYNTLEPYLDLPELNPVDPDLLSCFVCGGDMNGL